MPSEHQKTDDESNDFVPVARVTEVPPGKSRVVKVKEKTVALFHVGERFYAINNICPHEGGPLAKGRVKGYVVSCPWHDLQFDIRSGFGTDGGGYCVARYEVKVEDDQVYVSLKRRDLF